MEYRSLGNTGLSVSSLSFGASSLGSVFREVSEKEGIKTVKTAVDHGINYIDVSPYYGLTKAEATLGKAMLELNRYEIVLSSKAGRYGKEDFDFSYKRIIRSAEESLERLHTDYLDLLFLHDIEFGDYAQVIEEGIPAMQQLKKEGKIRFYGVSALPLPVFTKIIEDVSLDLILSYCHYSLNDTSLLELVPLLEKKGIGLVNASPLSMGLLHNGPIADWHPADREIIELCKETAAYCKEQGEDIAKLAIQFSTSNRHIPTTLISTASETNIVKNINWLKEPMNKELIEEVHKRLAPIQNRTWPSGKKEYHQAISSIGGV
ncbi:aldo/keto reductase [Alkalihalobacillus hemicellulosilyticus]|uniref:Putative oxidoreductase n=1 Tax=Halalkalibacter hemicellulosilyticusJCM 9152 TaxID=1236971 RepID=W4QE58_9BACI|nr:aldo/keto reductase [Halalkalibacter hemicellulosilyticus]GAE30237.1 putative oxidoreductase [Halalkalibacter hemicellulosilyticusJCM 9152]